MANYQALLWVGLVVALGMVFATMAAADPLPCGPAYLEELRGSSAGSLDEFGQSLAVDGNRMVVGSPGDDDVAPYAGAAYLYEWDGGSWVEQVKLSPDDLENGDDFGASVALCGGRLAVGAPYHGPVILYAGAVYTYALEGDTWVQEAKLVAPDVDAGTHYGRSVAMLGNTLLVGAPHYGSGLGGPGEVFVYERVGGTWELSATLFDGEFASGGSFGGSVAISEQYIVVGSRRALCDDGGSACGMVQVYERVAGGDPVGVAAFRPEGLTPYARFGWSVAVEGDRVLVGAIEYGGTGAAFVYEREGDDWVEQEMLLPAGTAEDSWVGTCVGLRGDLALVGAGWAPEVCPPEDPDCRSGVGHLWQVSGGEWDLAAVLRPPLFFDGGYLADSGVFWEDRVLLGAPSANTEDGDSAGAVLAFGSVDDCNVNGALDMCDIAWGSSEDGDGDGVPDECDPPEIPVGVGRLLWLFAGGVVVVGGVWARGAMR